MELDLTHKVVLVTGASSGIGRATAAAFAAEGANVMLTARRGDILAEAAAEVAAAGAGAGAAGWVAADFASADGPAHAVGAAVERFGGLDVLVNNAAPNPLGGLTDADDDQILTWLRGKPLGYLRAIRAAVPHLREAGGGVIVNVAGMSARHATHKYLVGTMATRAIHGMVKSLSDELAPDGTRVVGVDPGPTESHHFRVNAVERFAAERGTSPEEIVAEFAASVPLGRVADPSEIADVIVFLSSRRAGFVTGTSVLVDGGRSRSVD